MGVLTVQETCCCVSYKNIQQEGSRFVLFGCYVSLSRYLWHYQLFVMLPRASGGVRPCSTPQVKKSQTENKPGSSYEENKLFLPESRSGVTAFRLVSYFSELFLHAFLLRHPT